MLDAIDKYELVHKNLRLVKVDSDNCFDLADLSIKEDQIGFVKAWRWLLERLTRENMWKHSDYTTEVFLSDSS